jgi:hypothetical protein
VVEREREREREIERERERERERESERAIETNHEFVVDESFSTIRKLGHP